jgi:hypothetical protein
MNKTIGLILLTIGIGLTAGFGAILSPDFRAATVLQAEASFSDADVDRLHTVYCDARSSYKLQDTEGCGDTVLVEHADEQSMSKRRQAELAALAESTEVLILQVSQARIFYRLALKKSLARWTIREASGTQGPAERLSGWLSAGGAGFGLGLLLLVVGAVMCRRAPGLEAADLESGEDGPVDFGVLLSEVAEAIGSLHADMVAQPAPTVDDLEGFFKLRLEEVQKDAMARLCASGPRVTARHGLEGMAALFSPLSAAERKLNRAWAAMVDRHWPEALASVGGASADLRATQAALEELSA